MTVTDSAVKVSEVSVRDPDEIEIDEVLELEADVTENASNIELVWLSSDGSTVSVNNEGTVHGLKAGSAKIYAIAADSVMDTEALEAVSDMRTIGEDSAELRSLLDGAVYDECEITVEEGSPYLRNLHIPEETVTDDSVNLLWNSASALDAEGLTGYEVHCDGEPVAEVNTLGYTVDGLESDKEYKFEVRAVDGSGNKLAEQTVSVKTKPASAVVNVLDYGAEGNGRVLDTYAIQSAINACPDGGTVYLPEGYVFYSGALFLKSNMAFKVDGILIGSGDSKDYPLIVTRWEGWRKASCQTGSEWANTTAELPDNHYAHSSLINAGTYDEGEPSAYRSVQRRKYSYLRKGADKCEWVQARI